MGTLVAIDAQNLYYSAKRLSGGKVDYQKLRDKILQNDAESLRIVYLVRGDAFDSSGFENLLRGLGYRISPRTGHKVKDGNKTTLKYDSHLLRMSLDAAIKTYVEYDKFILISGDIDFSDLFSCLSKLNKQTEFWSFDRVLSPDLLQTVGKVVFLDKDLLQD